MAAKQTKKARMSGTSIAIVSLLVANMAFGGLFYWEWMRQEGKVAQLNKQQAASQEVWLKYQSLKRQAGGDLNTLIAQETAKLTASSQLLPSNVNSLKFLLDASKLAAEASTQIKDYNVGATVKTAGNIYATTITIMVQSPSPEAFAKFLGLVQTTVPGARISLAGLSGADRVVSQPLTITVFTREGMVNQ